MKERVSVVTDESSAICLTLIELNPASLIYKTDFSLS